MLTQALWAAGVSLCVAQVGVYVAQSTLLACSMLPRCADVPAFLYFQVSTSDEKMHKLATQMYNKCARVAVSNAYESYIKVLQVKCVKQCFTEHFANEESSALTFSVDVKAYVAQSMFLACSM